MEKPDETTDKEAWGTWEELLLGFAVNRFGTKSWDSVSDELQKRTSKSTPFLTPRNCKQRFYDLNRRYTPHQHHHGDDRTDIETVPWLDELRNLRIAELKRELQHYDLSIVSLQLKVKKLNEEREESLRACGNGDDKLDTEKGAIDTEPEKESVVGKVATADELDGDNKSMTQSNSSDRKTENVENVEVKMENDHEPVLTGEPNPEPASGAAKAFREESCNGSSNGVVKEMVEVKIVKVEPEGEASDSPELRETMAESKPSAEKESSDVQSSAIKLRKWESGKLHCGGGSAGDERETVDQSLVLKGISDKSHPVVDFLEILHSHKLCSVSERLVESQETSRYRNLIRRHLDLKSVNINIVQGCYLECEHKFFRDLLLLVNNVIVFFGMKSPESTAAVELRQLISMKMAQRDTKSDLLAGKQTSLPPSSLPLKQAKEPSDSLLLKPHVAGKITVCRKRSSITAKGSASSSGSDRKKEQTGATSEDKPVLESKPNTKSCATVENHQVTRKRTREETSASSSRSSKKNSKNLAKTIYDGNSVENSNENRGKSPTEPSQPENENPVRAEVKKRSAVNFLDRLKQTPSSNKGQLLDTPKSSMLGAEKEKRISEQKRGYSTTSDDEKKEKANKKGSAGKQSNGENSPTKRRLGRPPKRAAAPSSSMLAGSGNRSRAIGDTDADAASKQPKKRSRK